MPRKRLSAEQKVARAIDLMEMLAAAPDGSLPVASLQRDLDVGADEVDGLVGLVSTLADREAGTRAVCYIEDGRAHLAGEAGRILPLRLTAAEGAVLDHELDALDIDAAARERIRSSLLPSTLGYGGRVGSAAATGDFWQPLHEAVEDGVRMRILYRSLDDERARWRTVDPLGIDTRGDRTYLVAWDVDADEDRRYRLDKIEDVETTDDSVAQHEPVRATVGDSLAATGKTARLAMPVEAASHLGWAGIVRAEREGDRAVVTVAYSSERWLLSQVLSMGGRARILDDAELARHLKTMAAQLTIER